MRTSGTISRLSAILGKFDVVYGIIYMLLTHRTSQGLGCYLATDNDIRVWIHIRLGEKCLVGSLRFFRVGRPHLRFYTTNFGSLQDLVWLAMCRRKRR